MPHRYIFFGPQAAGKGTQAEFVSEKLHIPVVSTGPIFRKHMSEGTELGKLAKTYINKGKLVPDSVTIEMLKERLQSKDIRSGFILDGYPRTEPQYDALKKMTEIDAIVVLHLSDEEAIRRISGRRECPNGHRFHLIYNPPKKEGICDKDGLPLLQREDDYEASIRQRLALYHEKAESLIEHYRQDSVPAHEIDATPPIEQVREHVFLALGL